MEPKRVDGVREGDEKKREGKGGKGGQVKTGSSNERRRGQKRWVVVIVDEGDDEGWWRSEGVQGNGNWGVFRGVAPQWWLLDGRGCACGCRVERGQYCNLP